VLLQLGVTGIHSPAGLQKPPGTAAENAKNRTVGTGAFKYVDYARDQFLKLTKNTEYWMPGKPYADGFEFNQVADPVTGMLSFKKGEAHLIHGVSATDAVELQKAGFEIIQSSLPAIFYLMPDGANADSPFGKKEVREAVEWAIDKKAIATSLGKGFYESLTQFAKTNGAYFNQDLAPRNYDVAKAKKLLADAGYPNGFKTSIITINTIDREALVAIQTYLKDAGIDATLDLADAARFRQITSTGWKNGLVFPGTPSLGNLSSFAFGHFPATNNVSMYRGDWQKVLDQALAEPDDAKRTALLKQMVRMHYENVMTIPIWARADTSAADKKLHGMNWTQGGHPIMSTPEEAWLSK
jgi:ABC-type transport system substrate-binding protein